MTTTNSNSSTKTTKKRCLPVRNCTKLASITNKDYGKIKQMSLAPDLINPTNYNSIESSVEFVIRTEQDVKNDMVNELAQLSVDTLRTFMTSTPLSDQCYMLIMNVLDRLLRSTSPLNKWLPETRSEDAFCFCKQMIAFEEQLNRYVHASVMYVHYEPEIEKAAKLQLEENQRKMEKEEEERKRITNFGELITYTDLPLCDTDTMVIYITRYCEVIKTYGYNLYPLANNVSDLIKILGSSLGVNLSYLRRIQTNIEQSVRNNGTLVEYVDILKNDIKNEVDVIEVIAELIFFRQNTTQQTTQLTVKEAIDVLSSIQFRASDKLPFPKVLMNMMTLSNQPDQKLQNVSYTSMEARIAHWTDTKDINGVKPLMIVPVVGLGNVLRILGMFDYHGSTSILKYIRYALYVDATSAMGGFLSATVLAHWVEVLCRGGLSTEHVKTYPLFYVLRNLNNDIHRVVFGNIGWVFEMQKAFVYTKKEYSNSRENYMMYQSRYQSKIDRMRKYGELVDRETFMFKMQQHVMSLAFDYSVEEQETFQFLWDHTNRFISFFPKDICYPIVPWMIMKNVYFFVDHNEQNMSKIMLDLRLQKTSLFNFKFKDVEQLFKQYIEQLIKLEGSKIGLEMYMRIAIERLNELEKQEGSVLFPAHLEWTLEALLGLSIPNNTSLPKLQLQLKPTTEINKKKKKAFIKKLPSAHKKWFGKVVESFKEFINDLTL